VVRNHPRPSKEGPANGHFVWRSNVRSGRSRRPHPRYYPRNPPAHFPVVDGRRLCRDLGGTVNPSSDKWACMESRTQTVRLTEAADESASQGSDLLTAEEAAVFLRIGLKFVYRHAAELGGFRLLGDRGPWRFTRAELRQRPIASRRVAPRRAVRSRSARTSGRARTPSGAPLLPAEPRREAP
jgi:hypothetical protein